MTVAALHPQSHTPYWGLASSLHCEADSELGHVTRKDDGFITAWDLSVEIKKTVTSFLQCAGEAASLEFGLVAVSALPGLGAKLLSPSTRRTERAGVDVCVAPSAHVTAATRQLLINPCSPGLQTAVCFAQGGILFAGCLWIGILPFHEAAER